MKAASKASENDDFEAKGSPTNGAKKHASAQDLDEEESTVLGDGAKPPRRASVGWGAEVDVGEKDANANAAAAAPEAKRAGRRRKGSTGGPSASTTSEGKVASNQKNRYFDDDGDSTEIVEIPDLEEEEREPDITTQVAEAPRNTTRAVQSLKELDKDIKFALPNTSTFGIDLHLLTSALCPEKAVLEADEPWNFDSLLNDVSQELQKDLDEKEEFLKAEAG